jgi:hypothetical protein
MSDQSLGWQVTEDVRRTLVVHQRDFTRAEGRPFNYFHCPMLLRDDPVELCMGHVVNQSIPNSSRARVVQRKDIDGFYGSHFEAEFVTLAQSRGVRLADAMLDPTLSKKLKPRIEIQGERCGYHRFRGAGSQDHTPLELDVGDGRVARLMLHKRPDEVAAARDEKWQVAVEVDCRVGALVSLIKAAYLSLFRMLGYKYALSGQGLSVGRDILGRFFQENNGKEPGAVRQAAKQFFQPYVNMLRPIERFTGDAPRGTVDDGLVKACFGSSCGPFAMLVCVRTNAALHAVLMPAHGNAEAAATYWDFLQNENERLSANDCRYDKATETWQGTEQPTVIHWPKESTTFLLNDERPGGNIALPA